MVFEDAQQLRLRGERQLADLVEENRTLSCRLEEAGPIAAGARERAARVTEELTLENALGELSAVDGEKLLVATAAKHVEAASDHLLSRSGLAANEDRQRLVC